MNNISKKYRSNNISIYFFLVPMIVCTTFLTGQNMELIWADEFNENTIDLSNWDYDIGPFNDNVQYYTNRTDNVQVVDGVLKIMALEESYMGVNYTSGHIKTKLNWRYGRFEARIKLPATNGFVPAFWMLPADNIYGWWPKSGEIDIMEHPTNQVSNIYGSIHTETYNNFTGIGNEGNVTLITDAESEFHIYSVEWNPEQIKFFVDNNLYYTFTNDHSGSSTWPFDSPFYMILNLAVGGGWVGNPDHTTVFPAIMEVDWVRVYQYINDFDVNGADFLPYQSSDISYTLPNIQGMQYSWEVPGNAVIVSGDNSNQISVNWNYFGGDIQGTFTKDNQSGIIKYPVKISSNMLKNSGFEKGVKYWNGLVGFPAKADFDLNDGDVLFGDQALSIDVQTLGNNPWDVQLSQKELLLNSGEQYSIRFWAKCDNINGEINLALINSDFFVYHSKIIELSNEWELYEINYIATTNDIVSLNIDLGIQIGAYYFDQFLLTTTELSNVNQISNADFFDGETSWQLNTLGSAQVNSNVINGEYILSIANGGNEVWDIHLGQSDINIENGKEYVINFDAYSPSPRTISSIVGKNTEPWTVYSGNQIFSLTSDKRTYSYSFLMNNTSDSHARFGFDIGGSAIDVYLDNISLSPKTALVSISQDQSLPELIQLNQNYPNPFNPITKIDFTLPEESNISIKIYDSLGNEIKTIINNKQMVGQHSIVWDGTNNSGQKVSGGNYFVQLRKGEYLRTKKMVLLK